MRMESHDKLLADVCRERFYEKKGHYSSSAGKANVNFVLDFDLYFLLGIRDNRDATVSRLHSFLWVYELPFSIVQI